MHMLLSCAKCRADDIKLNYRISLKLIIKPFIKSILNSIQPFRNILK